MRRVRVTKPEYDPQFKDQTIELDIPIMEHNDDYSIIDDDKRMSKFVKSVKIYIRGSYEYKTLISFLKKFCGMDVCGVHKNLTVANGFKVQVHHSPFVMEDIIYTVIYKRARRNESLTYCDIAFEVMLLHYLEIIGLYPYCVTCHEFSHSDESNDFIPFDDLFGDPEKFFEIYGEFMSPELSNKMKNLIEINNVYKVIDQELPKELKKHYIYVVDKKTGSEYVSIDKLLDFIKSI